MAITAYHGTDLEFEEFLPMSHFGSRLAADDRIRTEGGKGPYRPESRIFEVEFVLANPLEIKDSGRQHTIDDLYDAVQRAGGLTAEEVDRIYSTPGKIGAGKVTFLDIMRSKGIDGLVYKNTGEDAGSMAYVVFEPSAIRIVKVEVMS